MKFKPLSHKIVFIWMICISRTITSMDLPHFIIWNVGQGLWTTLSLTKTCHHIDMGGEFRHFNWQSLHRVCGRKKNFVHFTHWDWDHINFSRSAAKMWKSLYISTEPQGPSSAKARRWLNDLKRDDDPRKSLICQLPFTGELANKRSHQQKKNKNNWSHVFVILNEFLVPGDSPIYQELRWIHHLKNKNKIKYLVLGHHGSHTSTSTELLSSLKGLNTAIASARYKRYRHPNHRILKRLQRRKINLMTTEKWGHIHIPLSESIF